MPTLNETRLSALSPTAFENLTFDLVRADAMENVHWRTPGADGGRDIECDQVTRDFAGHTRRSRWLIECKRYKASVNWPTVWEKVAYADNSRADYLLLVTTGKFSTRCLDEIEKWNALGRRPSIRVWPGHEIAFRLSLQPFIAAKYGLIDDPAPSALDVSKLSLHVSRMTQVAIAQSDPAKIRKFVIAASYLANLLYVRSLDITETGTFRITRPTDTETLPEFIIGANPADFDGYDWCGLVAYLACLHVVSKASIKLEKRRNGTLQLSLNRSLPPGTIDFSLLKEVAFWGAIIAREDGGGICLTPQTLG